MKKLVKNLIIGGTSTVIVAGGATGAAIAITHNKNKKREDSETTNGTKETTSTKGYSQQALDDFKLVVRHKEVLEKEVLDLKIVADANEASNFTPVSSINELIDVLKKEDNKLSADATVALVDEVLELLQDQLPKEAVKAIYDLTPVLAEKIASNGLIAKALESFKLADGEDVMTAIVSDPVKFIEDRIDLKSATNFVSALLKGLPEQLTNDQTEALITIVKSVLPGSISGTVNNFLTSEMTPTIAAIYNTGLFAELGKLIEEAFAKGIANVDFASLKEEISKLVESIKPLVSPIVDMVSAGAGDAATDILDELNLPSLVDVLEGLLTKGIFGLEANNVKSLVNFEENVLPLISLATNALNQYVPLINTIATLAERLAGVDGKGVATLSKDEFDGSLQQILGLVGSLPDGLDQLIEKLLYGFATKEEFINSIHTLLDSISPTLWNTSFDAVGNHIVVGSVVTTIASAWFEGKKADLGLLMVIGGNGLVDQEIDEAFSKVLNEGLFNVSKDDFEKFIGAVPKLAFAVRTVINNAFLKLAKLPENITNDLFPKISSVLEAIGGKPAQIGKDQYGLPIMGVVGGISPEVQKDLADEIYSLLHEGVSGVDADKTSSTLDAILSAISSKIQIPSLVKDILQVATKGIDEITPEVATELTEKIYTLIPSNTPVVSTTDFKDLILILLLGKNKVDEINEQKHIAEIKVKANEAFVADANAAISSVITNKEQYLPTTTVDKANTEAAKLTADSFVLPTNLPENIVERVTSITAQGDKNSQALVTVEVSSTIPGTEKQTFTYTIDGFKESQKSQVSQFIEQLKQALPTGSPSTFKDQWGGEITEKIQNIFKITFNTVFPGVTLSLAPGQIYGSSSAPYLVGMLIDKQNEGKTTFSSFTHDKIGGTNQPNWATIEKFLSSLDK